MGYKVPTPQITLRVSRDRHLRWKQAAELLDTSVSEQIRTQMDDWAERVLSQEVDAIEDGLSGD